MMISYRLTLNISPFKYVLIIPHTTILSIAPSREKDDLIGHLQLRHS
nr:MAG TPA: hypothetical protein [Caudoviricetes sp.]